MEQPLNGVGKAVRIGAIVLALGLIVLLGMLAIVAPGRQPALTRMGYDIGIVFCIGWITIAAKNLRKGAFNPKVQTGTISGMAWGFAVVLITLFMMTSDKTIGSLQTIVIGLVFLLMGAVSLITAPIRQSEISTREKLLEIEYALPSLSETIAAKGKTA